jgi:hypothetical protein
MGAVARQAAGGCVQSVAQCGVAAGQHTGVAAGGLTYTLDVL